MKAFNKTTVKTALTLALLGTTLSAQAAAISSMTITGGSFAVNGDSTTLTTIGPNTNLVGGYIGDPNWNSNSPEPNSIIGFSFFYTPINTFTAANGPFDSGGPVPTGDITGSVITMDLSSWFWSWNGTMQNQGNANATGTASCTGTSCTYNLSWSSLMIGGGTNGFTGHWSLTGTAQVVPIPAAAWLLGSGLLGLFGIARKKKR